MEYQDKERSIKISAKWVLALSSLVTAISTALALFIK